MFSRHPLDNNKGTMVLSGSKSVKGFKFVDVSSSSRCEDPDGNRSYVRVEGNTTTSD